MTDGAYGNRAASKMPLAWRIFVANATVFTLAAVALALSPATVSFPIVLAEATILAGGLAAILLLNLFLVRRALAPLARLTGLMHNVDLVRRGERLEVTGPPEVRELGTVFNEMLGRLEQERRESGGEALRAQEGERKRVAQELHDEVGQALTALVLQLAGLAASAPPALQGGLREAQEATRMTLDDIRRIARELRPEALDDLGLGPALIALTKAFADRTGLGVERRVDTDLPPLTPEAELVIFRVAQESLTNVARHADSPRATIALDRTAGGVRLAVRDYGRGLDGAPPGSGIRGMRERALLVGAELAVRSYRGGGTEVVLEIPASDG
jgi:two-component system sensor histidine kinase UhpB